MEASALRGQIGGPMKRRTCIAIALLSLLAAWRWHRVWTSPDTQACRRESISREAWYPLAFQDSGLITASGALAEYGGIPLNEAGRLYALAWNPSRIQGRQHQCMGYVPPYTYNQPGNLRFWEERDPYTQRLVAIKNYWQIAEGTRTIWMDDRPASAGLRAAHLGRIRDRQIRRQRADGLHNSPQARMDSRQWNTAERRGHTGGALYPARRSHHLPFGGEGSCVSG